MGHEGGRPRPIKPTQSVSSPEGLTITLAREARHETNLGTLATCAAPDESTFGLGR